MKKNNRRIKLGITLPESLIKKVEENEDKQMINKSKLVENLLKKYMSSDKK
jgi:metal-responsive CopG/Arc/MetJ family transcriptional regulator